jgi:hypothetical protein
MRSTAAKRLQPSAYRRLTEDGDRRLTVRSSIDVDSVVDVPIRLTLDEPVSLHLAMVNAHQPVLGSRSTISAQPLMTNIVGVAG